MTEYCVIEARPCHCGKIARSLRHDHMRALLAMGFDVHMELRRRFFESFYRKAWTIDGELAALGGIAGSMISSNGYIWLAISEAATLHPHAIIREARRQLDFVMRFKSEVATYLLAGDQKAVEMAVYLGFHPPGSMTAQSREGRRFIIQGLEGAPEQRVPIGSSYMVPVIYDERNF